MLQFLCVGKVSYMDFDYSVAMLILNKVTPWLMRYCLAIYDKNTEQLIKLVNNVPTWEGTGLYNLDEINGRLKSVLEDANCPIQIELVESEVPGCTCLKYSPSPTYALGLPAGFEPEAHAQSMQQLRVLLDA